ncbi:hypothetical protein ABTK14_20510, partial [Acinetobacter baumannii]
MNLLSSPNNNDSHLIPVAWNQSSYRRRPAPAGRFYPRGSQPALVTEPDPGVVTSVSKQIEVCSGRVPGPAAVAVC